MSAWRRTTPNAVAARRGRIAVVLRAAVVAAVFYALAGSVIDVWVLGAVDGVELGYACGKPYVPFCFEPHYRGSPISRFGYRWAGLPPWFSTNSLGYLAPEIERAPAPGVRRVVAFGGSTTVQPYATPYTRFLAERLSRSTPWAVEVLNLGTPHYSLTEIVAQLENEFVERHLDVALISEQWNFRDVEALAGDFRGARRDSWGGRLLGRLPLYGTLTQILMTARGLAAGLAEKPSEEDRAALLSRYEERLETIVRWCRTHGVIPVLGIHPDRYCGAASATPQRLFDLSDGHVLVPDLPHRVALKRAFAASIRTIAARERVVLVDWEQELCARYAATELDAFFEADGLHLTGLGAWRLAELADEPLRDAIVTRAAPAR